jgi:hypothetical protein
MTRKTTKRPQKPKMSIKTEIRDTGLKKCEKDATIKTVRNG